MEIIDFAARKAEREPHWSGECICAGCRHVWVGVGPIGKIDGLECPACGASKGHTRHPMLRDKALLQCNCGSTTFMIAPEGAYCTNCADWFDSSYVTGG